VFPDNVGIPLGGDRGFQSIKLQIHYDNCDSDPGIIDDSGVELFYMTSLCEHEAQAMVVGNPFLGNIGQPVGVGLMAWKYNCLSTCSASFFDRPVTISAKILHMDEVGACRVNQVIRNNEVVHEASVNVWDFRRNGIQYIQQQPYEVFPGDSFVTTYYTNAALNTIVFGWGTHDEMCQAAIWYYPAILVSHGLCGLPAPVFDPNCSSTYESNTADEKFDRLFGSKPAQCLFAVDPSATTSECGIITFVLQILFGWLLAIFGGKFCDL